MRPDFDEIIPRLGSNCIKYDEARKANPLLPEDFIPLWIADTDFACPQAVIDAMKARLDKRILGYAALADEEYYAAVDGWMQKRHGFSVSRERLVTTEGIVQAMTVAVKLFTEPGDKVLMNTPGYHPFEDSALGAGREAVYSPLLYNGERWDLDFADMEKKLRDPAVKLCFFCSPHNPTGRIWTEDELQRVFALCRQNGVFLFVDEIHHDLLRVGKKHPASPAVFGGEKGYLCATAPSKTFNIAGNRMSNILFPDAGTAALWRKSGLCGSVNALSVEATKAAYLFCEDWLEELRVYLDGNFAFMESFVRERMPKARFRIPDATFLGWLDLSGYGMTAEEMNERVSRAGVFIQFCDSFIRDGEGFARVNLGCPRSVLAEALERIAAALE